MKLRCATSTDSRRTRCDGAWIDRIARLACLGAAAACGAQVIYEPTPGGSGGAAEVASSSTGGVGGAGCGNGIVEPPEQCDDGPKKGTAGDPCLKDCRKDGGLRCGNGKIDPYEECDDGDDNSCVPGTMNLCTCDCKLRKCGDGVVQSGECCDDGNGIDGKASLCAPDCKWCKAAGEWCKCTTSDKCKPLFATVVSNGQDPNQPAGGFAGAWSYGGFWGGSAGNAMCQAAGAGHVCSYAEILAADAHGELAALPANLTYWLNRTTNAPDGLQPDKTCGSNGDCVGTSDINAMCDSTTTKCAWKPGAGANCNDWSSDDNQLTDGEWFAKLPDAHASGGVAIGSLSFHFVKNAKYNGVTKPVCQDENVLGCAGPCAGPSRAILCCLPCFEP